MKEIMGPENQRPLGNLTYAQASDYYRQYCLIMEQGVGFSEPESRLPTTVERMAEALKVECLNQCNQGADFKETCDFMVQGFLYLSYFLPDEICDEGSTEAIVKANEIGDRDAVNEVMKRRQKADDWRWRTTRKLSLDWEEFTEAYHRKYNTK